MTGLPHNLLLDFEMMKPISVILILIAVLSWANLAGQDDGLMVIGNDQGVPTELKKFQLNSVLRGERQRWNDGTKVVIALMEPDTPVGRNTATRVYDMSGDELQKYFLALVFQGKVSAPEFFDTTSDLEAFVARTPGAIGIVKQPSSGGHKAILIDGKRLI